jgi:carbon monoxide dehydrogenase subunit G
MGMVISNEFTVAASPDETYELMTDVERVAPCIPGASIVGRRDDGSYDAKATVKFGPLALSYKGVAELTERDPVERTAVLRARGSEQKGQGTAQALLTMHVTPEGEGSHVEVTSDILVTGRVAQMGRGIMQDVTTRMIGEMAKALQATLKEAAEARAAGAEPPPAVAAETPGVRMMLGSVFKRSGGSAGGSGTPEGDAG